MDRVRANLHIVITMSPVGSAFRNRLRMYPALVACTTIDWFSQWPLDALGEVGARYLEDIDVGSSETEAAISRVFVDIHAAVQAASADMEATMGRVNYVTPSAFLELVTGYV